LKKLQAVCKPLVGGFVIEMDNGNLVGAVMTGFKLKTGALVPGVIAGDLTTGLEIENGVAAGYFVIIVKLVALMTRGNTVGAVVTGIFMNGDIVGAFVA
jgi:hypothetical protein